MYLYKEIILNIVIMSPKKNKEGTVSKKNKEGTVSKKNKEGTVSKKNKEDTVSKKSVSKTISEEVSIVEVSPKTVTTVSETLDNKFQEEFSNLTNHYQMILQNAKYGLALLKKLEKSVNKDLKKKKKKSFSGFAKPTLISPELCKFLNKEEGTEMARTQVTKEINNYIKKNNLNDPNNKRIILADAKLKKIFNYDNIPNKQITYFNLQKVLKHHFSSSK